MEAEEQELRVILGYDSLRYLGRRRGGERGGGKREEEEGKEK